jgi:hypothetical protein
VVLLESASDDHTFKKAKTEMDELIDQAWRMYREAESQEFVVKPAIPILYFGNRGEYERSSKRIVTVGKNPSSQEFPDDNWYRFPALREASAMHDDGLWRSRYLNALDSYFDRSKCKPYDWFEGSFEPMLHGLDCSFYEGQDNTAIHTDLCSPIATDPTWSKLTDKEREILLEPGKSLWHRLVEALEPDILLVSIRRKLLGEISFEKVSDWEDVKVFLMKTNGSPRVIPYRVQACWIRVSFKRNTLLVFGDAAQEPFGTLGNAQRTEAGSIIKSHFDQSNQF